MFDLSQNNQILYNKISYCNPETSNLFIGWNILIENNRLSKMEWLSF